VDLALSCLNLLGYFTGSYLFNQKRISPKILIFCGGFTAVSGMLISTFVKNIWLFILTYGVMSGIGCGLSYLILM